MPRGIELQSPSEQTPPVWGDTVHETHVWDHMARRDRGLCDRCTDRCAVTGQTCPSARGRVAGEEMQTPTLAFFPLPIDSPYISQELYCDCNLVALSEGCPNACCWLEPVQCVPIFWWGFA